MSSTDRPWSRRLIKLAVRLLRGGRHAHAQDWLPYLRLAPGNDAGLRLIRYRGREVGHLIPSADLARPSGSRLVILGSGPSVGLCDVRRLAPRSAILLNGALSLLGEGIDQPLAVAIEDERFVHRHFDRFLAGLTADVPLLLSVAVIRALCERDPAWLASRAISLIDNIAKPYGMARRSWTELSKLPGVTLGDDPPAGFSSEPDRGVFQAGSVAVSALQFALAWGPAEVGFLGIDLGNARQPRFYERSGDVAFSGVALAEDRILAHVALAMGAAPQVRFVNFSPVSSLKRLETRGMLYDGGLLRSSAAG